MKMKTDGVSKNAWKSGTRFVLMLVLASTLSAPGWTDARQDAAIAGDPPFKQQKLTLIDIPKPTGPAVALFNGKDLNNWESWLGYENPALTYLPKPGAEPLGTSRDMSEDFRVVTEDGTQAIYIKGKTWGSIVHKGDYGDYHLRLEYKWGKTRFEPRLNLPENNGLLYHSHGKPGAVFGTWMSSVEFEIMKGSVGMVVPVGTWIGVKTTVGQDSAIAYPKRRYMVGGNDVSVTQPAWNVEANVDAEKPVGEWNTLDLYVLGDRSVHVVNGVPVMELHDLTTSDGAMKRPLTHGRIQLQSEGAETYFRNITLEPITSLPKVVEK
jgi:hypothetical protein